MNVRSLSVVCLAEKQTIQLGLLNPPVDCYCLGCTFCILCTDLQLLKEMFMCSIPYIIFYCST